MTVNNLPSSAELISKYKRIHSKVLSSNENELSENDKKIITIVNYLTKFKLRYRLAKSFKSINFDGYSDRTIKGYESGMRVMLSYSAYETALIVERLIKKNNFNTIHMNNSFKDLAKEIREIVGLKKLLKTSLNVNKEKIKEKIEDFYEKENFDIFCIAMGIRHTFAHGDFTAGEAEFYSAKNRKLMEEMSYIIIEKSDLLVRECLTITYR